MENKEALVLRPIQIFMRKISLVLLELTVFSSFFQDFVASVRAAQIAGRFRGFTDHHIHVKKFTNEKTIEGILAVLHHLSNTETEIELIKEHYLHFRELTVSLALKKKVIKKLRSLFTRLEGIQVNLKRLRLGHLIVEKIKEEEPVLVNHFLSITNCSMYLQFCSSFAAYHAFLRQNNISIPKKHKFENWAAAHQVDLLDDAKVCKIIDVNQMLFGH